MRQLDGGCVQLDFRVVSEHRPDLTLRGCSVRRVMSYRTRQPSSLPRYIPSPTHYAGFGTRVSAGFFSSTDGVAGARRAPAASWAVLDEDALLADGSFDRLLGMGAGSAIRPPQSDSAVLSMGLEASPCCPWELEGSMALNLVGGRLTPSPTSTLMNYD